MMRGKWYFIEKNGRVIWSYKRMESAVRRFELVCSRSNMYGDIVKLVDEAGQVIKEL